jgi:hypothetical protein
MLGRRAHLDPCEMLSSAVQLQIEDVVGRQPTEAGFAPSEPLGTSESTDGHSARAASGQPATPFQIIENADLLSSGPWA